MPSNNEQHRWLLDRTEIIERVVQFANAFDTKDWRTLRACLTERIETDYSQFRGEAPFTLDAEAYVLARQEGLAGLRTLHISTNHDVRIAGDTAVCRSAYRIYRLDPSRNPGENRFDTGGNYEHGLIRTADGWRINRIRQTVVVQEGNAQVHGAFRKNDRSAESAD